MFTGIVEEVGAVGAFDGERLQINARLVTEDLSLGDSVSVNGACLTAVALHPGAFSVELSPETLRRTNLGSLEQEHPVNLERALAATARLGGHIVQGHVDGRGRVTSSRPEGESTIIRIRTPRGLMRYIVDKGFVAVDGISLTVVKKFSSSFTVSVIPYTLENTNMKRRRTGDMVNLEVDILAKYVESLLSSQKSPSPADHTRKS